MTNSLQQLSQQGGLLRVFQADRNAAQVAACLQRFQRTVQVFLVGNSLSTLNIEMCLSTAIGGKYCRDGEQRRYDTERSRGESEHFIDRPRMIPQCVLRDSEVKCEKILPEWKCVISIS